MNRLHRIRVTGNGFRPRLAIMLSHSGSRLLRLGLHGDLTQRQYWKNAARQIPATLAILLPDMFSTAGIARSEAI